jgi:hypothetical protein
MTREPSDDAAQWAKQMQDVLADSSKIRDGLPDAIAIPFVEWGADVAEHLAARFAAPETPDPDEEQVRQAGYNLARLMTRINWLVTYRTKKDDDWLTRTFAMVNKLSQDVYGQVYGDDAPTLSDDKIAAWMADHASHADETLIRDLMAQFTPPALAGTETAGPPGAESGPPPEPLSNAVFGPPNLSGTTPDTLTNSQPSDEAGPPHSSGDEQHGEEIE